MILRPKRYLPDAKTKPSNRVNFTAVFEEAPEGGYTCHFTDFPDVFSEGETILEAKANLVDALQLVLAHQTNKPRN